MLDNLKFDDFSRSLDEMAKGVPAGSVVKQMAVTSSDGKNHNATYHYGNWSGWSMSQPKDFNGTINGFYIMKVDKSSSKFVEGTILYENGLKDNQVGSKVRFHYSDAAKPGKEYSIFEAKKKEIDEALKKSVYVDGTEAVLMDHEGGKITGLIEGEYKATSMNFKLSVSLGEPVIVFYMKNNANRNNGFSLKLDDLAKLLGELSAAQKSVVASHIARKLGLEVKFDERYDRYEVWFWNLSSYKDFGWVSSGNYGPFASEDEAKEFREQLTKLPNHICDVSSLEAKSTYNNMKIEELMAFCGHNGLTIKMKDVLSIGRGAVAGRKFGLGTGD